MIEVSKDFSSLAEPSEKLIGFDKIWSRQESGLITSSSRLSWAFKPGESLVPVLL